MHRYDGGFTTVATHDLREAGGRAAVNISLDVCQNSLLSNDPPITVKILAAHSLRQPVKAQGLCVSCRFMWRKYPTSDEIGISLIHGLWPDEVPDNLDAVYENVEMNQLLFFKGMRNLI